jgi:hypothetical protein
LRSNRRSAHIQRPPARYSRQRVVLTAGVASDNQPAGERAS